MTYECYHRRIIHAGSRWVWTVQDFAGCLVAIGRTPRREDAREEMNRTVKKLKKAA